jgi:hypothetical protein
LLDARVKKGASSNASSPSPANNKRHIIPSRIARFSRPSDIRALETSVELIYAAERDCVRSIDFKFPLLQRWAHVWFECSSPLQARVHTDSHDVPEMNVNVMAIPIECDLIR